jgi:hypothetical protein
VPRNQSGTFRINGIGGMLPKCYRATSVCVLAVVDYNWKEYAIAASYAKRHEPVARPWCLRLRMHGHDIIRWRGHVRLLRQAGGGGGCGRHGVWSTATRVAAGREQGCGGGGGGWIGLWWDPPGA